MSDQALLHFKKIYLTWQIAESSLDFVNFLLGILQKSSRHSTGEQYLSIREDNTNTSTELGLPWETVGFIWTVGFKQEPEKS